MTLSEQRDIGVEDGMGGQSAGQGLNLIAVIGIDCYKYWPQLSNARNDALGAAALFEHLGFAQATSALIGDNATGRAIQSLVTDDLVTLGPHDSLVLFYAGHGGNRKHRVGSREITTGYLIPVDAEDKVSTWVELEGWLRAVSLLPAKHILVILDACHSGIALDPVIKWRDSTSWRREPLSTLRARQSRRIITSALGEERAMDSGPHPGHSLFTGCLIEALTHGLHREGEPITTGSELGLYVQQRVKSYPYSQQTPDFGTFAFDERGEMVIPLSTDAHQPTAVPATQGDATHNYNTTVPMIPIFDLAGKPSEKNSPQGNESNLSEIDWPNSVPIWPNSMPIEITQPDEQETTLLPLSVPEQAAETHTEMVSAIGDNALGGLQQTGQLTAADTLDSAMQIATPDARTDIALPAAHGYRSKRVTNRKMVIGAVAIAILLAGSIAFIALSKHELGDERALAFPQPALPTPPATDPSMAPASSVGATSAGVATAPPQPAPSADASWPDVVAPLSPPTGDCYADVSSIPSGAEIVLDQTNVIGTTPQRVALPCHPVELLVRKAHLVPSTYTVTPTPQGTSVQLVLVRQTFLVKVSSTPPGAMVTLGGKTLGVTPTMVKVPAFESSNLSIAKDGYRTETETVAPRGNGTAVHTVLKKLERKKTP